MKIKVDVTAEDIANGECGSYQKCPVALAVRRETGVPYYVGLDILFFGGHHRLLPLEVTDFINQFDDHGPEAVKPQTFELEII